MKWFFCLSASSLDRIDHGWRDLIVVAVKTAIKNTTLEPHLIYDGPDDELVQKMRDLGVQIVFHRSQMYEALRDHANISNNRNYLAIASGAFLRWSIPLVETGDDYVFYTDVDVMFMSDPTPLLESLLPFNHAFLGAGEILRESEGGYKTNFNSGILLINQQIFRNDIQALMAATIQDLAFGLDQEWLIRFYNGQWGKLPEVLNFKPYWSARSKKREDQPVIIHFHGPKPAAVREMMSGGGGYQNIWRELYANNTVSYNYYISLFENVLGRTAGIPVAPIKFVLDNVDEDGGTIRGWVLNNRVEMPEPRIIIFNNGIPCAFVFPAYSRPDLLAAGYRTDWAGFNSALLNTLPIFGVLTARNAYDFETVSIEYKGWTGTVLHLYGSSGS
jgi:hypothetical protein